MSGIGRGRGRGRPFDKMDADNDKKKEHPPITIFRVGPGRSFAQVVGENPGRPAAVAEMLKKFQGNQIARKVPPPPRPQEMDDFPEVGSDDLTSTSSDSTSSSLSSEPGEMTMGRSKGLTVSSEVDSEVDDLKVHLRKKRQTRRNLERMRQERIWRFRQPANEIGSDSSDDEEPGEDVKRKWKLREELLQAMRENMKKGSSEDEEEKNKKGRSRNWNMYDRMKNKRKRKDMGKDEKKK